MTCISPEANAEQTAGNGMHPAQEGYGQVANSPEGVRLDRDLDAELALLLKQLQDPTLVTAGAVGEHTAATSQNEKESTVAHPSLGGASIPASSSSTGETDKRTPEGLKEDAAPAESGGSFDDGAASRASAAEVGARTAPGTGGRTKKGAASRSTKKAGPSSSAASAAVAKEKIAAKEVTRSRNVPPPVRPQLRARVAAAQGKRTPLSRATKATTASKITAMGHAAKDENFSKAHPLLGISSASTSKQASTASAKLDTPVPQRRFSQQRLKATTHMPRQRRQRPSPTGCPLSVGLASEGLTGEVSLSKAIPTKAARHSVAKAIRSAIAAVAESVVSAATASDKQSGIAATAGTTPRGSTVAGAQEGSGRIGEKCDTRQTDHGEDASGTTFEDPQLASIPGAERESLVERRNHLRTAATSRRPGRQKTKVVWRRTCGVAPSSDYDGLDFRWGMYPQDRRWNEEDLRYSYVDVLASPPHPVYAGPSPPAMFGCRGPASSKGISSAPLCSSDGIANALPYRTLYERPANYIVGMQYDTHYQLPTLSRLLHARQPEFLQHSLAPAEHVKVRRQHCLRAPHSGCGPLCAPLNVKFRLNLQFPNEMSCPPLEIQGKLYRTPGGKYKFSFHSAKRTGSRAARVPESPQSWEGDGSAPAYVYQAGEDTRKESDSRTGSRATRVPESPQSWKVDGSAPAYVYQKGEDTRKVSDARTGSRATREPESPQSWKVEGGAPAYVYRKGEDTRKISDARTGSRATRVPESPQSRKVDGIAPAYVYRKGEDTRKESDSRTGSRATRVPESPQSWKVDGSAPAYAYRKGEDTRKERDSSAATPEPGVTTETDARKRQTRGYGVRMADSAMLEKDGYAEGEEDTGSDVSDEEQFDESEQEDTGKSDFFAESDYAEAPQRSEENDHCDHEFEYTGYVEGTVSLSWQSPEASESSARQNQSVKTLW